MEQYELEKWIWTDADFETMGWHDSFIYAIKLDQHLYFDIDYIFRWEIMENDIWYSFWVAPCTLIFKNPTNFKFQLETNNQFDQIEIADIYKDQNSGGNTEWRINSHFGDIIIEADTFEQIVRRPPTHQLDQRILHIERGEVSFSISYDQGFLETDEIKKIKQADLHDRKNRVELLELEKKYSTLYDSWLKKEIESKEYMINKRLILSQIAKVKESINKE